MATFIPHECLRAAPWKNGGGSTTEIAISPPDAGFDDFDWRISVATIAADGPFSAFAGIDRVITLLAGAGVLLQGMTRERLLDMAEKARHCARPDATARVADVCAGLAR